MGIPSSVMTVPILLSTSHSRMALAMSWFCSGLGMNSDVMMDTLPQLTPSPSGAGSLHALNTLI